MLVHGLDDKDSRRLGAWSNGKLSQDGMEQQGVWQQVIYSISNIYSKALSHHPLASSVAGTSSRNSTKYSMFVVQLPTLGSVCVLG